MPSESATIAPELDAGKAPSKESDDDFIADPSAPTTMAEFDEKQNDGSMDLEIDCCSVMARNKYTPDGDDDNEEKKDGSAPDIEEAVAATTSEAAKTGASVHQSQQQPSYPPSFFTNERGNLKIVSFVVRYPCAIFTFLIALCIIISFLLQVMVFRTAEGGNPFTLPSNEFDLDDVRSIQYDSYRLARDEVQASKNAMANQAKNIQKQSELADIAMWVFESETPEGVFGSAESIEGMKDAFDIFIEDVGFKDYCVLDYTKEVAANETRECLKPLSPLVMYYASEWDEDLVAGVIEQLEDDDKVELFNSLALCYIQGIYCELLPEDISPADAAWAIGLGMNITSIVTKWDMEGPLVKNYNQVTELASHLMKLDVYKGYVDFGFDNGFSTSNPVSQYSRGIVYWGGPLSDVTNNTSDEENEEVEDTEDDQRKEFIKEHYLEEMEYQSEGKTHPTINSYYFMTAIIGDVILKIVTKDAMLALFSFAFIFFWLRVNVQSWFLAFVGLFEIFFAIPVAWFIFSVIFQIKYFATLNTLALFIVAAIGADDIFIFIDAYKQSQYHLDVLVDLETRMSWVYRRTGTAMAITSATTCAAFLCTLITPLTSIQSFGIFAAVVIFIDYVLVMTLFCTAVVIYHNRYENSAPFGCCCPCGLVAPSNTEQARVTLENSEGEIERDRVSEFFKTKVAGFIKVPLHRLVMGVVFLTWLCIAIWQATLLEATKENEQFLDEDHPLQKSITILNTQFPTAQDDLGLKIYYAWGIDEVDRTGVNRLLKPENYGSPNFDPSFEFNQQCQTDLLSFCDKLKTDPQYSDLIKRKEGVGLVYCFIEELAAYNVKGDLADCDYVRKQEWKDANVTWQVDPADLENIMPGFLNQKTCFDENNRETVSGRYQNEIGWNGFALRFAAISAESNQLDPFGRDAESLTRKEYDQFVAIAEEQDAIISKSCSGSVIMTDLDEKFVFMNNQSIYVQSAIQGACLGVAIAFAVLLISTRVFHLAFFASLSIMSVLVSVIGTMVMLGMSLGSTESILIAILAGFSVDYVVHLAHAYEIAKGDTYDRLTEAFSDLGISVFNGMITSVVASIPLFFCQLTFFATFGTFLCLTIAFSWIFANFGFMSVLAQLKIPLKEKGCRL
ncbi:hypothetical protein ACHAXR_009933 [Thalassiosira sp. AJA248-18]